MSTAASTQNITPTAPAKIPAAVHASVKDVATAHGLNGLIVLTAYQMAFEAAAYRRQRQFLREARKLFPQRNVRQGRGNVRQAG